MLLQIRDGVVRTDVAQCRKRVSTAHRVCFLSTFPAGRARGWARDHGAYGGQTETTRTAKRNANSRSGASGMSPGLCLKIDWMANTAFLRTYEWRCSCMHQTRGIATKSPH